MSLQKLKGPQNVRFCSRSTREGQHVAGSVDFRNVSKVRCNAPNTVLPWWPSSAQTVVFCRVSMRGMVETAAWEDGRAIDAHVSRIVAKVPPL
jgi:hypothetical protein